MHENSECRHQRILIQANSSIHTASYNFTSSHITHCTLFVTQVIQPTNHTRRMAIANGTHESVSVISLRHILASPGTIVVHVTWMERGFNAAGQTHSSIYPSIFNHLRAIARYWSEIATFSYHPCI